MKTIIAAIIVSSLFAVCKASYAKSDCKVSYTDKYLECNGPMVAPVTAKKNIPYTVCAGEYVSFNLSGKTLVLKGSCGDTSELESRIEKIVEEKLNSKE